MELLELIHKLQKFLILYQRRFSKFFLVNQLYSLDGVQSLGSGIRSLGKFFFEKLDVCIAEGKEGHP